MAAATVNINGKEEDPFYRYKMPKLTTVFRGNKTVLTNIERVAAALRRPSTYICKHFAYELGACYHFDKKNNIHTLNGLHCDRLTELLRQFTETFVVCAKCENPETTLKARGGHLVQDCTACGHLRDVNSKYQLTAYIFKNLRKGKHPASPLRQQKIKTVRTFVPVEPEDDDDDFEIVFR